MVHGWSPLLLAARHGHTRVVKAQIVRSCGEGEKMGKMGHGKIMGEWRCNGFANSYVDGAGIKHGDLGFCIEQYMESWRFSCENHLAKGGCLDCHV